MELILEGGKAVNGRPILQSEVPTILNKVDEILSGLGLVRGEDWDVIGSAGRKRKEILLVILIFPLGEIE